jgi:hypothetical protein
LSGLVSYGLLAFAADYLWQRSVSKLIHHSPPSS